MRKSEVQHKKYNRQLRLGCGEAYDSRSNYLCSYLFINYISIYPYGVDKTTRCRIHQVNLNILQASLVIRDLTLRVFAITRFRGGKKSREKTVQ